MNKQKHLQKYGLVAYTLAEMLIVMGIMAIVLLSLPSFTKKLFRVEETRKPHGRFECYWDETTGNLMSYYAEEGGVISGPNVSEVTDVDGNPVCEFNPPKNPVYFIIHAVGGGGAGAMLDTANLSPQAPTQQTAISSLHLSVPSNWPDWAKSIKAQFIVAANGKPFDISRTYDEQYIQYRIAGSPAPLESLFVPQLDPGTKIQLAPGKGGVVSDTYTNGETASGGAGASSYVRFIKGDTNKIGLEAKGGVGGDGEVIGNTSFPLRGQVPGDFGVTNRYSLLAKASEFVDVIENASDSPIMKSKVPTDAGSGGAGSSQTVLNTDGKILYRWIKYKKLLDSSRRLGRTWVNITSTFKDGTSPVGSGTGVGLAYETANNGGQNSCVLSRETLTERRVGYCTMPDEISVLSVRTYYCTVGYTEDETNQKCTGGTDCIAHKYQGNAGGTFTQQDSNVGPDYSNCRLDTRTLEMNCDKAVTEYVNKCTTPTKPDVTCASGVEPMDVDGKKICPPSNGKDGAVIILW